MTFLLNCYWVLAVSVGVTCMLMLPTAVCAWLGIRPDGREADYLDRRLAEIRADRDAVANAYVAQCEAKIAARANRRSDPGFDPST
jgi:hypothetical protein